MKAPRSRSRRIANALTIAFGSIYLVLLHYYIFSNSYSAAAEEVRLFTDSLFAHARDAVGVERCPLHGSVLYEGIAEPVEIPAPVRLIYRRPEINYCGFYLSQMPSLDELPFPGIFSPDTLLYNPDAPPIHVKVCDECRSVAFIYLEPHYGFYLSADSLWHYPGYNLITPPRRSPPRSSQTIAALR
ncbi:MAG: hypothetical protein WBQ23_10070 [Bacteroidota bacterium]